MYTEHLTGKRIRGSGKCLVLVNGEWKRACSETVEQDMTVMVPQGCSGMVLTEGMEVAMEPIEEPEPFAEGYRIALDIGTTTVVCYLMDSRNKTVLAAAGAVNPQKIYGADVTSRIQAGLHGQLEHLQALIASNQYLKELLAEEHDKKKFLIVPEHTLVHMDYLEVY